MRILRIGENLYGSEKPKKNRSQRRPKADVEPPAFVQTTLRVAKAPL
jgi:hypothetical protein